VRFLFPALLLLSPAALPAQTPKPAPAPITQRPEYRQAVEALQDRLPEVAITRLEKLLATGAAKGPALPAVKLLLAEACVRAGRGPEALTALMEAGSSSEANYWRGAALALTGRYAEAEKTLAELPENAPYLTEAAFTRASMLTALGQPSAALALLKPLMESKDAVTSARAKLWSAELLISAQRPAAEIAPLLPAPAAAAQSRFAASWRYLRARLALLSGNAREAAAQFTALAEGGKGVTPALQQAAALGRARALEAGGQKAEALTAVEKLIGLSPPPPPGVLLSAFELFERLNSPPVEEAGSFIATWQKSEDATLRLLAKLAATGALEAAGKPPVEVLAACKALASEEAANPLLPWVLLRQARLTLAAGDKAAALAVTAELEKATASASSPAVRAWTAALKATAAFDDAQFKEAARQFLRAAQDTTTADARIAAAYNAALAELYSGLADAPAPLAMLDGINTPAGRTAGAEFHLERALYLAASGQPGAESGLTAFVTALPQHPRRFEALLALAELTIRAPQQDAAAITRAIEAAAQAAGDPAAQEAVAWLRVQAAETGDSATHSKAAEDFLTAWPQTTRRTLLHMRLGESHYRRQNFAAARAQFELLAKEALPGDPLIEPALFWAGKAALLTLGTNAGEEAIALWEQVASRAKDGSRFKLEARLQIAQLKQRRSDFPGALQLLEEIITSRPDPNTRRQALCTRGEILAAPAGSPADITRGLASFDEVAADTTLPPPWRHEALVRKGVSLEQLKRTDEALAAYHQVLTEPPTAPGSDDYWFHRAGEKALRMMESRGKFEEAVSIAEKMARAPGPRGQAAAALVNTLVLKYRIWRDSPAPATSGGN
jgi:hypothetical protein